jgi:UDPglucose 6-dehydrogenase
MKTAIHVVGSGVVGSAFGLVLDGLGHDVRFVDTSSERRAILRSQGQVVSESLQLQDEQEAVVFLTLPTPSTKDGYDLRWLEQGTRSVGASIRATNAKVIVANRSTVYPGACDTLIRPWLEESSGKSAGVDFEVASVPEFLRQASALEDAARPWITVIGSSSDHARAKLADLLRPLGGCLRVFDNATTAETIKIANNCYNAAKISFWNELWTICDHLGLMSDDVAESVAISAEGSFNPTYGIRGGFPFGGACLPKDLDGLIAFSESVGLDVPLLQAVRAVNDEISRRSFALEDQAQATSLAAS